MLVWFVLLFFCVPFYGLLLMCVLVVVECVLFGLKRSCVSFVVYCETLSDLFVCFRVCDLFYVFVCHLCDLLCDVVWCICLCVLCESVCLKFNVFVLFVCGLSCDGVCCVGVSFCVCVLLFKDVLALFVFCYVMLYGLFFVLICACVAFKQISCLCGLFVL